MQHSNDAKLVAMAVSGFSAFALFVLLLSWAIGGSEFFYDVLLGNITLPVLVTLCLPGAFKLVAGRRGKQETGSAAVAETA